MKANYQTPAIEVIKLESEGIIAASIQGLPNEDWGIYVQNPAAGEVINNINPDNKA
ncbi:hypothetical protein [Bacteroides sp. 214]|uniref:hypothetical protein n=1 Tax=Bacteroides sp. 214 TaxID=2302935 RepID=UPI0013D2261C|nr:hypothetical protein [Bacteroides sp. 214]